MNPPQVRAFASALGKRAKTDPIDALVIARFAATARPQARTAPDQTAEALAYLVTRRRQIVAMIGAEKQREKRALARLLKALHKELSEVEADVAKRFEVYRAQIIDLQEASMRFTEGLRDIYPIRTRVDANALCGAHVSMGARTAATHEAVGVSTRLNAGVRAALVVSSDRRERRRNTRACSLTPAARPDSPSTENQTTLTSVRPRV